MIQKFIEDSLHIGAHCGLAYWQTASLLRAIALSPLPTNGATSLRYSKELYQLAHENKIPLAYLDIVVRGGGDYPSEYDYYLGRAWEKIHTIADISDLFDRNGIDYAILQLLDSQLDGEVDGDIGVLSMLLRDPDDIDIRIMGSKDDFQRATRTLIEAGYTLSGTAPKQRLFHCSQDILLDVKCENSISHLIYVDTHKMDWSLVHISLPGGVQTKVLNPEAHLLIILADAAICKNHYKLADYYFASYCLSRMDEQEIQKFLDLVVQNHLRDAARWFFTLTLLLHAIAHQTVDERIAYVLSSVGDPCHEVRRLVLNSEPPYPCDFRMLSRVLGEKLRDRSFRRSLFRQAPRTFNPVFIGRFLSRMAQIAGVEGHH